MRRDWQRCGGALSATVNEIEVAVGFVAMIGAAVVAVDAGCEKATGRDCRVDVLAFESAVMVVTVADVAAVLAVESEWSRL